MTPPKTDITAAVQPAQDHGLHPGGTRPAIVIAALGIVFGDIGTSPLYAFKETLNPDHGILLTHAAILGLLSLIFWGLLVVVTLKYVVFVLRADYDGEGGILALQALARRALENPPAPGWLWSTVAGLGLTGAGMFYGDSLITPAISVLSAIEGLDVATPAFKPYVIPITISVLVGLFMLQRYGTGAVGRIFGPVMLLWFGLLAGFGLHQILQAPQVLAALDPRWATGFLMEHRAQSLSVLGAVFLAFTGGEALYADMGHFGAKPIRFAWLVIALPALVVNYFGQGALVLGDPGAIDNPFYRMLPGWALLPMVALAAMATVIASQAVISGAFSITAQAMRMGYLPRMRLVQTSGQSAGQIYLPFVNWVLLTGVLLLVLGFRSSSALSSAYGIAVSITMVTTTLLAGLVAFRLWHWNRWVVVASVAIFAIIDLGFVLANSLKILDGGWITLVVAAGVLVIFTTWANGRRILLAQLAPDRIPLAPFVESLALDMPFRAKGTAVFLGPDADSVPHALLHNLKHNQVLHERVIVMVIESRSTPKVQARDRISARALDHGIWVVTARHGFMERPNVPEFIRIFAYQNGVGCYAMTTSYFTSRTSVGLHRLPGINPLRQILFAWMQRNAGRASDYFELPDDRLVEMGQRI